MSIDDKLRDMKFTNIFGDDDHTLTSLTPNAVAQIKQAFTDEGYLAPDSYRIPPYYFTGQEWYGKFIKEWDFICTTIGSIPGDPEMIPSLYGRIADQAAKKAAGL